MSVINPAFHPRMLDARDSKSLLVNNLMKLENGLKREIAYWIMVLHTVTWIAACRIGTGPFFRSCHFALSYSLKSDPVSLNEGVGF